jgi:hypothetical protein
MGTVTTDTFTVDRVRRVKTFIFEFDGAPTARYVRVVATNVHNALLLTDEVVVY